MDKPAAITPSLTPNHLKLIEQFGIDVEQFYLHIDDVMGRVIGPFLMPTAAYSYYLECRSDPGGHHIGLVAIYPGSSDLLMTPVVFCSLVSVDQDRLNRSQDHGFTALPPEVTANQAPLSVLTKAFTDDLGEQPGVYQATSYEELIGLNVVGVDFTQHEHPLFTAAFRRMRSRTGEQWLRRL